MYAQAQCKGRPPRAGKLRRSVRRSTQPIRFCAGSCYLLPKLCGDYLRDLCVSFQQAIVDVLVQKTIAAARKYDVDLVTVSGGVSCNQELRRQMREKCARFGLELKTAEPWLCTDNAAMIAFAASLRLAAGFESKVTEEIDPNLALVR